MVNLPNFLSLLRLPLAFIFLQDNPYFRALAIFIAMATDGLDGFVARRYQLVNRVGTLLDPLTDKFFVFFVLTVLIGEGRLSPLEGSFLLCRDFAVILYGFYLAMRSRLFSYQFRAIWCGKITTALQFIVLLGLTFKISFPVYVYGTFLLLGIFALGELYQSDRLRRKSTLS